MSVCMNKPVSIITVNYNGWQDTCEMMASFKEHETYPYEMIVVDNGSSGDDADRIAKAFPEAKVVRSECNLGFAGGNNLGCRHAQGEYFLFLNNDTVIKAPVLEVLVNRCRQPGVGGVSPLIRFFHAPDKIQYCGWRQLTRITVRQCGNDGYGTDYVEGKAVAHETEVMHGAAMMLSRMAVEQVGMMAECFFLYYEEYDWSSRLSGHGFRLWYEPAAMIFHKEGTKKGKQMSPFRAYYMTRSRLIFTRRRLGGFSRFLSCGYLAGVVAVRNVLRYSMRGNFGMVKAVMRGTLSGLTARKEEAPATSSP